MKKTKKTKKAPIIAASIVIFVFLVLIIGAAPWGRNNEQAFIEQSNDLKPQTTEEVTKENAEDKSEEESRKFIKFDDCQRSSICKNKYWEVVEQFDKFKDGDFPKNELINNYTELSIIRLTIDESIAKDTQTFSEDTVLRIIKNMKKRNEERIAEFKKYVNTNDYENIQSMLREYR